MNQTDVTKKDILWMSLAQVLALIPGTSRSGITMTAGLFSGLSKRAAAEMSFFMAVQTLREVNEAEILGFFQSFFPDRYKFVKRKFMQENIYDFTDFKNQTSFSVAFKSKLMLFSANGNMVENALVKINKVNNEILKEDKLSFIKNSGDGFNLHVNYGNFAGLLNTTLGSDSADKYAILESFAQRAVYNISLEDEQILLKGAAQTHDANFEFLDLLHAQAPIENNLRKLLPERIHFSYTLGFNGYRSFAKNVKEYLTNKNRGKYVSTEKLRGILNQGKIGSLLRKLDPIGFNVGFNEWKMYNQTNQKT
jgi:hypothetical protein